jgi:non-specific serine/threonine protein kinase
VQPGFTLTLENAQAVAEICQRLDGIPLAIELAAARVKVIGVKQIAAYLNSALGARFSLLTQGSRVVMPRHQTLRAAIDWSYNLLSEEERLLFRQVAVFRGSFTLEALEEIVAVERKGLPKPFPVMLDLLTQLVDKSLVIVEEHGGQSRYHLLETMREYAAEQLRASGEEALWRARHAAWYLELAKRAAPKLEGAEQPYWFALLESEHDNLRAALHWYADEADEATSGLQLSCAIAPFWCIRNYLSEGQQWIERFLRQLDPETEQQLQVDAINFLARLTLQQSNFQAARLHYERSLTVGRQIEHDEGVVTAMIGLGGVLWELGEFQKARASVEEAVRFARAMQHLRDLGRALNNLGLISMHQGDHQTARAALNECLLIYRQIGSKTGTATVLFNLGMLTGHDGDFVRARLLYEESLAIDRELGNRTTIADSLHNMGGLATDQGDLVAATAYFEEAAQIYREVGAIGDTAYTSAGLGDIAFYEGDYERARARYTEALALFRKASNQRLIARVLGQLGRIACREGGLVTAAMLCSEALTIRLTIGHKPGMIFALDQGFLELALATEQLVIAARILGGVARARKAIARPRDPMETRQLEPFLMRLREQLGDGEMAAAWAEGEKMELEEVATYTLNTFALPADRLLHPEN